MKLKDVHKPIVDALCYHEAFLRLGFSAEDIYVGHQDAIVFVVLKTQKTEFQVQLGVLPLTEAQFTQAWEEVTNAYNNRLFDENELQAAFMKTFPSHEAQQLLSALTAKGIVLPVNLN